MTRNELVIAALAGGDVSTAAIAQATGLSERACRSRLRYLIGEGYAWSPERGWYRLTGRGRAIAADVPSLATSHALVAVPEVVPEDVRGTASSVGIVTGQRAASRGSVARSPSLGLAGRSRDRR